MEKIILYGASWCPDCVRSIRFLDEHNIKYEYIDVESDPKLTEKVIELNEKIGKGKMKSIPIIIIGDKILSEPSNEELNKILNV
jgi:glutaredoxin